MSSVISLHVLSIKGFPTEIHRKNKGSQVSIVTDIGSRLQECGRTTLYDEVQYMFCKIFMI